MRTFIEIVFRDPVTGAQRKRIVSTDAVDAIDQAADGSATVLVSTSPRFPTGGSSMATFEAYGDVVARLAAATPSNPTATVSATDQGKADSRKQAYDQLAAQDQAQQSRS